MAKPANPDNAQIETRIVWQRLRLLTFYRLILAGLLAVLYFALQDSNPFGVQDHGLFRFTLLAWLVFSLAAGTATRLERPGFRFQAMVQLFTDIGALSLLIHATGGVSSPLTALLVITIAVGALLLPGRMAYLFAAVASIALLLETGVSLLELENTSISSVTRAGLMGLVLFATAALAHVLAIRLRESEALATQRGIDLANLQQLNQYVIHQLQSGILVVDPDGVVRLANDRARALLNLNTAEGQPLGKLSPALAEQIERWHDNPALQPESIQAGASGADLTPRFARLETSQGSGTLVLLDDDTLLAQQSQQLKLASLGRMSASIAHEIRNPLGAISHAAQLLSESGSLNGGDKRLTEIINNHSRRVNEIIESILQLSRRSVSQPQELRLGEWLRLFHGEFIETEGADAARLVLDIGDDELSIECDPGHLRQVLSNLSKNALRHSPEQATVELRATGNHAGRVRIEILDNGPGIDREVATQIFEPFFTTENSGTGLGLYIARELCEQNRAHLSYHRRSEAGGSCFRIEFSASNG
ncbi:two-component system sensor histidine kinase PilS (NtrC family) [Thiogranum longum]|uniref:histidine kinase n=1 Tax=Thiogranum longum TaxID=1537524 RepID=A0A4R1H7Z8_9GAMM|nr:ATP-binding protein [Thiogranum longum]TCK17338.1 two-component system sensor histidine kinase PilS (NtrC family) [Thiogranum longum]